MAYPDYFGSNHDTEKHPPKHIRGITCDVKNCAYHDGDNYCTADRVTVGPSYATACTETVCATFKPKAF